MAGGKGRKKRGDQSFARFINLLEDYKDRGIWDRYLELAGAPKFQEALAAEAARTGEIDVTGPLQVLDDAIERAAGLGRIADAAGLTLSRARWTRQLELRSAQAMLQPAGPGVAHELTGDLDREQLVLHALLRTWELRDAGNPGAARAALGDLVRGETPVPRPSHGATWAVPLLRHALAVDEDLVGALLRRPLVDDNVLTDLSHALTEAGELSHARTAALAIRLFTGNKVKALGEIAVRQAQAGDRQACADTEDLARRAAADFSDAGGSFIFQGRTLLAAARVLCGAPDGGRSAFADVTAEASQQARAAEALAAVATAQVRAGQLADAERTIAALPADDPRSEAAATLVAALAERGDVIGARQALSYVRDNALCYLRAVRALAGAVARANPVSAERLAKDLPRASACGYVLAEVATAARAAGHREEAVRIVTGIQDPGWQARALVDLARAFAPDEALPGPRVLDAISGVPDAGTRAILLAQYAVTRDGAQRSRLLGDAKKLACEGDPDERWATLAEIALVEADAGVPDVAQTFAAARTRVLADREIEERHLLELCRLQELAGDSAGARQTVAAALPRIATSSTARFGAEIGASLAAARARLAPPRGVAWAAGVDGPEPDTDRLLAPVTHAAIAAVLARSMAADPNPGRRHGRGRPDGQRRAGSCRRAAAPVHRTAGGAEPRPGVLACGGLRGARTRPGLCGHRRRRARDGGPRPDGHRRGGAG